MLNAKTKLLVTVAGYEVSLELPRWPRKLRIKNEEWRMTGKRTQGDFFGPVWEGLNANHESRITNHGDQEVATIALPWSYGLPWRLQPSQRLEAQVSMVLGAMLLLLGIGGMWAWSGPLVVGEMQQVWKQLETRFLPPVAQQQMAVVEQVTFADYVARDEVLTRIQPVDRQFGLIIPKIEVNSKVIANVDAALGQAYFAALKDGLAHAAGTKLPGESGDIFIFGHSTDYAWNVTNWNALFYNLKELEAGDKVYVYYQGSPRVYQVIEKGIYSAKDVSFLHVESGQERLVLQTCYPPGTTYKRLVVFAEPVESGVYESTNL